MRLFTALEVSESVRETLDAAVAPLRARHPGLAWNSRDGWHLTVAFLGEVVAPLEDIAAVLTPVAAGAPATIRLTLTSAGRFGRRVLWVGVRDEPAGAVAALAAAAQQALAEADLPVDVKEVRPHLTVARARRRGGDVSAPLVAAMPRVEGGWTARELVLMSSTPGGYRRPSRYEPRVRLPLGC
ncbi:MAG: RNA 2',3'-cyclic phosphodiesterase [Actinomycetota bacterium]|nr:RNA 2',3'-cyclic phosphodiesterase [Actinomycetota bacterium]